jgi:DNA-binding protein H-NS
MSTFEQPAIDLDTISLEQLEQLTERKRQQLHQESLDRKAQLESEIAGIGQQIDELQARKGQLEADLRTVAKSLGLGGSDKSAKRAPRKPRKAAETEAPASPEA